MVYQYRPSPARSDARLTDAFGVGRRYPYTMGLRCLLGHEYANREVEREREERGDEVVVTYRTVETCDRCGERRVVSENKEVRPIRNPRDEDVTTGLGGAGGVTADMGGDADGESAPSDAAPATDDTEPTAPASTGDDDGVVVDAEAETEAETVPDAESDPAPDPAEEDAVILDDDATENDDGRAHGEWPSSDDEESGTTAVDADAAADAPADPGPADDGTTVVSGDEGWPEPAGDDEGFDAEPSDGGPTDVSFGGGLAPERADEAAANGEAGAEGGAVAGKQFVAAEAVEPVGEESSGETEFFCPNCGYARAAGGSSMRAGDICPDCHKGYIAERER